MLIGVLPRTKGKFYLILCSQSNQFSRKFTMSNVSADFLFLQEVSLLSMTLSTTVLSFFID